jgi:hypothetical protein
MRRSDLVHRLGDHDIGSGQKALTAALLTGLVAPHVVNQLADALKADDALVGFIIAATIRQRCDEARLERRLWQLQDAIWAKKRRLRVDRERVYLASFRPHVEVQTERAVPSPIFVAAM